MKIKIVHSAVIDAPLDRVWAVLRDFNSFGLWHPEVTESQIENSLDGDVVGCVRHYHLSEGQEFREQLLRHSDRDHAFSYCILDSSLPLFDYVSDIRLKPVTDGDRTFWDWRIQFQTAKDRARELDDLIGHKICRAGFKGLRMFLAEQTRPSPKPAGIIEITAAPIPTGESIPTRSIVITAHGGPEVMTLQNQTVPPPGPGQVRLRHTAIAVNYQDIEHRQGLSPDPEPPFTPGLEGVGRIIDVGPKVNGLFPGDRVAYLSPTPGAYTEVRCLSAEDCLPLPENISDLEASTLLKGITAALLLNQIFHAAPGDTILIRSIAGGQGHLLSQWAKSMDLTVIGTVSTEEKARFIRNHGCDYPIVLTKEISLSAEVMRITNGRGVDCAVHGHGEEGLDDTLACMAVRGRLAVMVNQEEDISIDLKSLRRRSLTVSAPVCFDFLKDKQYLQRLAYQLFSRIQRRVVIPVLETLSLDQAAEVLNKIEGRENAGGVVLLPGGREV